MEKVKNYIIAVLAIVSIVLGIFAWFSMSNATEANSQLSAKEREIQQFNAELGLANSRMLAAEELSKKYKNEIDKYPKELQKIIDEHNLKLQSRDQTIARLQNKIKGGTTTVVVKEPGGTTVVNPTDQPQVISYTWQDNLGRFKLIDPDIFVKENEEFSSSQNMRLTGHVFRGKDGQLQIRKVSVEEVVPDGKSADGQTKYKAVSGSNVNIVDSSFEYINNIEHKQKSLLDIFTWRILASYDTSLTPGVGIEILNLGRLIDYANVGLNTKLSADLSDPLNGSLANSRAGIGINYQFIPPLIDTNLSLGVSISSPFSEFGQKYIFSADAIFYLTNDFKIN